jgi:MFS family permease
MKPFRRTRQQKIYYGWPMLLGLSLAQVTSWGIVYYTFAVFLAPVNADLGWSIAQMTGAFSVALLLSGLAAIPVGRWIDRHGPRAIMTIGSILATLLVIAWSRVDSLPALYLIWAALGVVMATILYEPAFIIVANWFERLRSRALTILTVIAGLASVVYIPLAAWLIEAYGWRTALLVLAGILAIGTVPIHALMLRHKPADLGLDIDGEPKSRYAVSTPVATASSATLGTALHDRAFWWISTAFILATFADMALTIHLIPFLIERGHTAAFAATAAAAIGLVKLPGRVIFVPIAERFDLRAVIAVVFSIQATAIVALVGLPGTVGVLLFVGLFGAVIGAVTPARASLIADTWGREHYGSISGALAMSTTVARSVAPVGAGLLYVLGGNSYIPVMWLLVGISVLAAFAVLRARPRKVRSTSEATA